MYDASRNEDFTLRLKLYCTVCDFPGRYNPDDVRLSRPVPLVMQACAECTALASIPATVFAFAAGTPGNGILV